MYKWHTLAIFQLSNGHRNPQTINPYERVQELENKFFSSYFCDMSVGP